MIQKNINSEVLSLNQDFHRIEKWAIMMENWDEYFTKNMDKVKKRVRKGIPDFIRGAVWQIMNNSLELAKNHDDYEEYLKIEQSEFDSVILRDITRTFPKHPVFRERAGPGQRALFNVLKAYSVKNKEIGYCQGMGFISALFLSYIDEEDDYVYNQSAFWLMEAVVKKNELAGFFKSSMPALAPSFYKLVTLLKRYIPKLHEHFYQQKVVVSMYASQWFLTVFCVNFNFDILTRIWDIYLLEGIKTIYRFGLAVLSLKEKELLETDFEGIMEKFKTMYNEIEKELLVKTALNIKVTNKMLQALDLEYTENPNSEIKESLMIQQI